MIRITRVRSIEGTLLCVEGKLLGPWVAECAGEWAKALSEDGPHLTVELSGVTFISPEGRKLLARIVAEGGELRAGDVMNRAIIDEIQPWRASHKRRRT